MKDFAGHCHRGNLAGFQLLLDSLVEFLWLKTIGVKKGYPVVQHLSALVFKAEDEVYQIAEEDALFRLEFVHKSVKDTARHTL